MSHIILLQEDDFLPSEFDSRGDLVFDLPTCLFIYSNFTIRESFWTIYDNTVIFFCVFFLSIQEFVYLAIFEIHYL